MLTRIRFLFGDLQCNSHVCLETTSKYFIISGNAHTHKVPLW